MENTVISDEIIVIDSDEIDTVDTLLIYDNNYNDSDEVEYSKSEADTTENTNKFKDLEKITLDNISYNFETDNYFKSDTDKSIDFINIQDSDTEDDLFNFNTSLQNQEQLDTSVSTDIGKVEIFNDELLEPMDLINNIYILREKSKNTVRKLRELKTMCEQAIVDIEHKIEFEQFTIAEGYNYSMLIKELRVKRRFIKNTLDKYDAVNQTLQVLDKNFSRTFVQSQKKAVNRVIKIQSSRQYTPRILKNLEITGKASMKNTLKDIESEISNLLENVNI